jgi:hypothetical protein
LPLLLAGTLTGNEIGSWLVVHPALSDLSTHEHILAEQALTHRYGAVMPPWMMGTLFTSGVALSTGGRRGRKLLGLAVVCYAAMLGVTLLGNLPINQETLQLPADTPAATWLPLRQRWERLHTVRVALDLIGFLSLCAAQLVSNADGREER